MVDDLEVEDIKLSAAEVQFIREEMKIWRGRVYVISKRFKGVSMM